MCTCVCEFWQTVMLELYFYCFWGSFLYWTWFRDYFGDNGICFHSDLVRVLLWVKVLGIESDFPCKQLIASYRLICWEWPRNLATPFGWNAEYATHITPLIPHIAGKFCVMYPKWGSNKSHVFFFFSCSFRGVTEIARWSVEYIVITFWIVTN